MKVFRMKATAYLVVGIFILTHMCLLYSSIADCGIDDINAEMIKFDNLYDEWEDARDEKDDKEKAYSDYVDTIAFQYAMGILVPAGFGLFGGWITAAGAGLLGATVTTIKVVWEASGLLGDYNEAKTEFDRLDKELSDLTEKILLYQETHEDDDSFNQIEDIKDKFNINDGGCNDGGCNDGGCNDGAYT